MATTSPATPPAPATEQPDWPAQAADAIVEQVGKVRDRTTGPAIRIAGYVVFGAFATLLGTVALLLFIIGVVRAIDVYLPGGVWAAHTLLGALLVLAGLFTSRKMKGERA